MAERRDYREEYILHAGDTIESCGVVYTITGDFVGYGGSGVVYSAKSSEDGGNILRAIKEVFPNEKNRRYFERKEGIVCVSNPEDEKHQGDLRYYRNNLEKEQKLGARVYNTTIQAVNIRKIIKPDAITIDGKRYTAAQGNVFAVLDDISRKAKSFGEVLEYIREEKSEGHPLRTGGCPTVYTTACLMEQVLKTLQKVHKEKVLFGDIHMGNILLNGAELEKKEIGIASFLDFGCARELIDGKKTAIIEDCRVYSTEGYVPPEILEKNDGTLQLGKEADIFSVGALMLKCLCPQNTHILFGRSPEIEEWTLQLDEGKDLGINDQVRDKINAILKRAMAYEPKDRYPDTAEMLDDILKLKDMTELPKYLLPANLSSPDYFVPHSRDKELDILAKAVGEGETVFLHGVGGIGKTECAIQLAQRLNSPKGAYLVHFQNSMRETVLKMNFSGYKFGSKQEGMSVEALEEAEYQERVKILCENYRGAVLIIDNFDADNKTLDDLRRESAFQDFLGLDLKRIFTTRYPVGKKEWEIRELADTDLLNMMRYYCKDSSITDEQYIAILQEIQNHTLTAALIAKTLEESWGDITPEMILEVLRNSKLSGGEYPEVVSDQNRSYQQRQIYEHLKALFDLSGMNEKDKKVLCCATLLPAIGMDALLFKNCLKADEQKALVELVKHGWTMKEDNVLKMHPVIREVCIEELKPKEDDCKEFLGVLWGNYNPEVCENVKYLQMAECFARTINVIGDIEGFKSVCAACAAYIYDRIGKADEMIKYFKYALQTGWEPIDEYPPLVLTYKGRFFQASWEFIKFC